MKYLPALIALLGVALLVGASFLVSLPLGLAVAGVGCLAVAATVNGARR